MKQIKLSQNTHVHGEDFGIEAKRLDGQIKLTRDPLDVGAKRLEEQVELGARYPY